MIKYNLICPDEHEFEAWFQNSAVFDTQKAAGYLTCPHCGNADVNKAIMAPHIPKKESAKPADENANDPGKIMSMMNRMRDHVEKNFDYVGDQFAEEARSMHYGEKETRDIYGETTPEEAAELFEEGVSVAPLPGVPGVPEKQKN